MLRDIILNNPSIAAIACIGWIGVIIWVVWLVTTMIQGDIDPGFGFVAIGLAVVLGYWTFNPPLPWMRVYVMLLIIGTLIVFPILRRALNQRELVAIDVEAMENQYEILKQKPDNHMAKIKLARVLYERGQVAPALSVANEALKFMPEKLFTEEHRMVGRWKRQNRDVDLGKNLVCVNCGMANKPSDIFCERCRAPYLLDLAKGRWVGKEFGRKLLAGWIVGVLALAGIPFAASLPPAIAVPLIVLIMAGAFIMLFVAFRHRDEVAAK